MSRISQRQCAGKLEAAALDGRLRVIVSADNKDATALIDTGAACSLVSHRFYLELCAGRRSAPYIKPERKTLVTLTGEPVAIVGRTRLNIMGHKLEFVVCKSLRHDILLGTDSLSALGAVIDCAEMEVRFDGREIPCQHSQAKDIELAGVEVDQWVTQFPSVMSDSIGCTKGVQIHIDTGNNPPIRKRAYRLPLTRRKIVEEEIDSMLKKGVIRPSESPWASPVTLVPKKDGSIRFCIDYRALNAITVKDSHPLPHIQDVFDSLAGAGWFTTLDLRSGYWQVGVAEEDICKTAFITHNGLFEWVRMPFGLCNAPAVFQREMQRVLGDALGRHAMVYIDDIVIFSKTEEEHEGHVHDIMGRLRAAGLVLKQSKCRFRERILPLLGYMISGEGIAADPEKTRVIHDLIPPKNVPELRRFLGMAGYYRQLIQGYANITTPLTHLTKRAVPWVWTVDCQTAFNELKEALVSSTVMAHPQVDKPYMLYTDASDRAVGAILVQEDEQGLERPIQYISRALKGAELRWSTIEKEAFSIVNALTKLRPYLYGAEFTIYTDHRPLKALFLGEVKNTKVQRWASLIAEYNAPIKYWPGKNNVRADMLSRINAATQMREQIEVGACFLACLEHEESETDTVDWIDAEANPADSVPWRWDELERDKVAEGQKDMRQWEWADNKNSGYHRRNGLLWYTKDIEGQSGYPRLVLPPRFRNKIMSKAHKEVGHQGYHKTLNRVRDIYWWPKQRPAVRDMLHKCAICRMNEPQTTKPQPVGMPTATYPGEMIGMDLVGPLSRSDKGNTYIFTLIDHATGWAEAYPIPQRTGEEIVGKLVSDYIPRHGVPAVIVHDRGTEFMNNTVREYLEALKVDVRCTTPYHPQTNGKLERWHRTLKSILRKLVNNNISAWEEQLGPALMAYRQSVSETTGYSPFYLLYGRRAKYPANRAPEGVSVLGKRLEEMTDALHLASVNTQRSKERFMRTAGKIANAVALRVGDRVLPTAHERAPFDSKWDMPREVIRIRGNVVWCRPIGGTGGLKVYNRGKLQLVSMDTEWNPIAPRITRYHRTRPQNNRGTATPAIGTVGAGGRGDNSVTLPAGNPEAEMHPDAAGEGEGRATAQDITPAPVLRRSKRCRPWAQSPESINKRRCQDS